MAFVNDCFARDARRGLIAAGENRDARKHFQLQQAIRIFDICADHQAPRRWIQRFRDIVHVAFEDTPRMRRHTELQRLAELDTW